MNEEYKKKIEKLKQELLIMKTLNIKPNYSELSRIYKLDRRTIEKYSDDEKVRITLNGSTGTVEFTISPEEKDNTYLIADDILFKA